MAGALTTLSVKDALGTTRPMRAWDESGTGVGPFSLVPVNSSGGSGSGGLPDISKAEDAASASGDLGLVLMAIQTSTPSDTAGSDGDYAPLQIKNGRLYVQATIKDISNGEYETVAASQTAQAMGATGATGDYISGILVIPATTSPGNVLLLDGATSITVFTGGATSVSNLVPFFIPLGMISVSGAWKITTGASVSCIGIGNFT
jgi:hypothetical protein